MEYPRITIAREKDLHQNFGTELEDSPYLVLNIRIGELSNSMRVHPDMPIGDVLKEIEDGYARAKR